MRDARFATLLPQAARPQHFQGRLPLAALLIGLFVILTACNTTLTPTPTATTAPTATLAPTATPVPTATNTPQPTPTNTPQPKPTNTPQPPLSQVISHGNPNRPEIALTFDDGPAPTYTAEILSILQRYQVPATFFLLGSHVQTYPDLARAEVADGYVVGDHTWSHPNLTQLSASQITQQLASARQTILQVTGVRTTLFRPPGGSYNRQVLISAASLQLTTILWSIDPRDWSRPGTSVILNVVLANARNGSIILLHDGGGDRSQTVAALPTIIESLLDRGFSFVTISQMLRHLALTGEQSVQTAVVLLPGMLPSDVLPPSTPGKPSSGRR
jgi:peptidoglycan/xylan/chitin deacetylase (PgdA/CDA1 family)